MRRTWWFRLAAAVVIAAAAVISVWLSGVRQDQRRDQRLIRALRDLPPQARARAEARLRSRSSPTSAEIEGFPNLPWSTLSPESTQELKGVIQEDLVPVPIRHGMFQQVTQPANPYAPVLTAEQQDRILRVSKSVGRIIQVEGSSFRLAGTGFVVARGDQSAVVATNCHVLTLPVIGLAEKPGPEGVVIPWERGLRVEFSDGPVLDDDAAFAVTRIRQCTDTDGLDVALLEVNMRSVGGGGSFPPPLTLQHKALRTDWDEGTPELIGVIGYPQLKEAGRYRNTRLFLNYSADEYAKFYSPGAVTFSERQPGFEYLLHLASTMAGQSGSPMVAISGAGGGEPPVIAVHSCCQNPGAALPPRNPVLGCASVLLSDDYNLSIAMWSVAADRVLKKEIGLP